MHDRPLLDDDVKILGCCSLTWLTFTKVRVCVCAM